MQEQKPYIIGKKHIVRRVYWGRIAVAVTIVCLAVIGLTLLFSRSAGRIVTDEQSYWFVCMGEYDTPREASARAVQVAESGGAGYVYADTSFKVVAACYAQKDDAQTVSERLGASGEAASVFSIRCASVSVEKPKKNADALKKMLLYPQTLIEELYDISVKTDTQEISGAAALFAVTKLRMTCDEYAQSCKTIEGAAGEYLVVLFTALSDTLAAQGQSEKNPSQAVKYALCQCAVQICTFTDEFIK